MADLNDGTAAAAAETFALDSQYIKRTLLAQHGVLRAAAECRVQTGLSMVDLQIVEPAVAEPATDWICERLDLRVAGNG
ncbi:hypothetical protein KQH49_08090 [Mycetohabitans sp. B5]|uniref:Uncharacterized protein n=1 Tax=Mycetohabitans endofungorum TaxID=417203 RepID=A0A2P5KAR2_9BURK|nr:MULTISPECIES: hypothetical protein [Mycetohabitans]MCG1054913.1 hypothetical protein [Mycetohabitans sp. B5]PPB83787.1 hypothetical protein B0O95_106178 [Mycetohabitans endofungorum]